MKNILIIRDIPLKTELKIGFSCFSIVFFYLLLRFFQHYVYYVRLYVCDCLYPQDCILIWIYRMQINYITLHYTVFVRPMYKFEQ